MQSHRILAAHPAPVAHDEPLAVCIDACFDCAQVCTGCADACLAEQEVESLRRCIHTDMNCADICNLTGWVLSRQTEADVPLLVSQVKTCREACEVCARECDQHRDHHVHCAICADTCRACAEACQELLKAM